METLSAVDFKLENSSYMSYDSERLNDVRTRMILHWNYRNLKKFPIEIINNPNEQVKEIYLKWNSIRELPEGIGSLINLTNLYLGSNQLTELPSQLGKLRNLRILDLSANFIKKLPSTIAQLIELEQLILTQNQISSLPELKNLKKLNILELSRNSFTSLKNFGYKYLENLREINIDSNPIKTFPRDLNQLQKLQYFSICATNITFLPSISIFSDEWKQSQNNINEPFILRIDGNSQINYIPYWIHQLNGKNGGFHCFGCGIQEEAEERNFSKEERIPQMKFSFSRIILRRNEKEEILNFDEDLHCGLLKVEDQLILSLRELSLRKVYSLLIKNKKEDYVENEEDILSSISNEFLFYLIPSNLVELLLKGPSSNCFNCNEYIFNEGYPFIFELPSLFQDHDGKFIINYSNKKCSINITVIFFCSSTCILHCKTYLNKVFLQNEINWEQCTY